MQIFQLTINFLLFAFLVVVLFYPFGFWILKKTKTKLADHEVITLSLLVSLVSFVLIAGLLGVLNLRFLLLPLILASAFVAVRADKKLFSPWRALWQDKILLGLVVLAIFIQGFINFPSGFLYSDGLLFWSSQGNDGLWHVALMEEAKKSMPLVNPIYAGDNLYNYHYLVDILMGEFGRIFSFFSSLDLYFRFFPVVFSLLISLSVFSFLTRWQKNKKVGYWGIFFTSLAGGFGYIVTLIRGGKLFAGETIFWAAQGNTIIGNPPHAASYALLAGTLLSLLIFLQKRSKAWFILTLLLGGVLAGFKVSAGFVLIVGVGLMGVADLIFNKKKGVLLLSFLLGLSNLIAIRLMTRETGTFLIFEPWWFVRTTIVVEERLGWITLEHKRQHYVWVGTWRSWLRAVSLEAMALGLFVAGNLGTRVIGFWEIVKRFVFGIKKLPGNLIDIVLLGIMLAGVSITLLFVQKGIAYNLIQFFQYFIFVFGFYSAILVVKFFSKIKNAGLKVVLALFLIALSVPTVIGNLVEFYGPGRTALAKVSNEELVALEYLKKNSDEDGLVLTLPFDKDARHSYKEQPWPISVWYSTAYVPALSSRRAYLTNEDQVNIVGLPGKERRELVEKFFRQEDLSWNIEFLKENEITHLYIRKADLATEINGEQNNLIKIFENTEAVIFEVI